VLQILELIQTKLGVLIPKIILIFLYQIKFSSSFKVLIPFMYLKVIVCTFSIFYSRLEGFKLVACLDFEACWRVQSVAVSDVSSMLESGLNLSRLPLNLSVALVLHLRNYISSKILQVLFV